MKPTTLSYDTAQPAAPQRRAGGKSLVLGAMIALNLLLVVFFINKNIPDQQARAQVGRPSEYLMVPGSLNGVTTGVVFIMDTSTGKLSYVTYNDARDFLDTSAPSIDLNQVFKAASGVNTGGPKVKPR